MKKSQLLHILKTFSPKEIREMRKWLHSPAHNQRQDVIQLFEYFFEDNHINKEDFLDKATVFSWIFSKQTYDDAKMRQTMFFLLKTTEDFLVNQKLSKDEINKKIILASVYRNRKLDKLFHKCIKQTEQLQENSSVQSEQFYINEYFLEKEKYEYFGKISRLPKNLQQVSDSLDVSFLVGKLRQVCLMLSHQSVYQKEYDIGLLDKVLPIIESKDFIKIPAIAIFYFIYKTLIDKEDEEHFFNLKEQIKTNGHLFPLGEIRDIYLMAINYCIRRMNAGTPSFIREAFEMYRLGFEKEILIENKRLTRASFHNVVSIALKLKEYEWVQNFINDYQQYLKEEHREGFVYYSLARLHYEEKDYDKAMKLLVQEVHYDDIIISLSAKTLLAKMYYEQDEFDVLESLLESMRTYIQRKKVLVYHKNNYKNILKYTKKLLKVTPYSSAKKEKLRTEITEATPLTEKDWLLHQLDNL